MPANLTPQYLEAEARYKRASTDEEKLETLEEMLRTMPKHKGTEKLQADLKRKIAEQKREMASDKGKKKHVSYAVESHGYPQVVVIGPPNSGRSLLISKLTGAELKVADYPYTTLTPQPAMMTYQNVRIQLVDNPPIGSESMEPWLGGIIRAGDAVALVADLANDNILEDLELVIKTLDKHRIFLASPPEEPKMGDTFKKTLLVANKVDISPGPEILEILRESFASKFEITVVSALTEEGLLPLKQKLFLLLGLVRIYSKPPGKKPDMTSPILLKRGSNIVDLATHIHQDVAQKLRGARIWGNRAYTEGQQIPRDYIIEDEDIIELTV